MNMKAVDGIGMAETIHPLFLFVAYGSLIDILILPYFPLLIMPYSLPVVLAACLLLRKITVSKIHIQSLGVVSFFVLLSVVSGIVLGKPNEFLRDDFLRAFQFLTTFIYFIYYYAIARFLSPRTVNRILLIAIAYATLIAIGFLSNPAFLISLREQVYTVTAYRVDDILIHGRFTYFFSDPNTAGYFLGMLFLFSLERFRHSFSLVVLLLAGGLLIAILTKSTGVSLSVVGAIVYVILRAIVRRDGRTLRRAAALATGLCLLLAFVHAAAPGLSAKACSSIGVFGARVEATAAGSRLAKYTYAATHFPLFLWGQGSTLVQPDGNIFAPHSDMLYLLYAYGVIVYVICMFLFFRRIIWPGYLFMIPAFMAFSVNGLIGEQKTFALFLILLALSNIGLCTSSSSAGQEIAIPYGG